MIKISHETPLDLLETSRTFNDFDYCLPTYYKKYPKYKEFFLKSKQIGRHILLDNGLFEGDNFTDDKLIQMINEIQPNQFVVPDVWNNSYATLNNAIHWKGIESKIPVNTELMIVPQGKTYSEISELIWSAIKLGYKSFGFNHSSIAYLDIFPCQDPMVSKMMGRVVTINRLMEEDVFDKFKNCKIHLLGMNLYYEAMFHNKKWITSMDTSNPVIMGLKGIKYNEDNFTKPYKPEEKIGVFMEGNSEENIDNILFNIAKFRKICS